MRKSIEQNRLVHSRINQECSVDDISEKIELFHTLLDFNPTVIIIDGLDSSWEEERIATWTGLGKRFECMVWITSEHSVEAANKLEIVEIDNEVFIHCKDTSMTVQPQTMLPTSTRTVLTPTNVTLFSGGTMGAEAFFGKVAESIGIREVNFTFEGHEQKRTVGRTLLNDKELTIGSTSLSYVSNVLNRNWKRTENLQKVVQVLWHIVSHSDQVFVVGTIQPDGTVHGGTGWSVELAKRWYKPIWVFDQSQSAWFSWNGQVWEPSLPTITSRNIAGSGTRFLNHEGKEAIRDLFNRSFQ